MPPFSLASSNRILTAFEDETPYVAAGPERSVCMPSTISVLVTPRVSFCATATPTPAMTPTTTLRIKSFFIARSLRKVRPGAVPLSLRVHVVDHVLVLGVDERTLEL